MEILRSAKFTVIVQSNLDVPNSSAAYYRDLTFHIMNGSFTNGKYGTTIAVLVQIH